MYKTKRSYLLTGSTKYPEHFGFERIGDPRPETSEGDGAGMTLSPERSAAIFGFDVSCAVSSDACANPLFPIAVLSDSDILLEIDCPRAAGSWTSARFRVTDDSAERLSGITGGWDTGKFVGGEEGEGIMGEYETDGVGGLSGPWSTMCSRVASSVLK